MRIISLAPRRHRAEPHAAIAGDTPLAVSQPGRAAKASTDEDRNAGSTMALGTGPCHQTIVPSKGRLLSGAELDRTAKQQPQMPRMAAGGLCLIISVLTGASQSWAQESIDNSFDNDGVLKSNTPPNTPSVLNTRNPEIPEKFPNLLADLAEFSMPNDGFNVAWASFPFWFGINQKHAIRCQCGHSG